MAFLIISLSLLFFGIGIGINKGNAKYLLAGYNTMPEAERQKVDIDAYLPVFRRFHQWFAIIFLLLGLLVFYYGGEEITTLFIILYPIAGYLFFWWISRKFSVNLPASRNTAVVPLVLLFTLGMLLALFFAGMRESVLHVDNKGIKITGVYGETLSWTDIQQLQLVDKLPDITLRKNGYAVGRIRKGYFTTRSGDQIKLLLNNKNGPFLRLHLTDGRVIYYNSRNLPEAEFFEQWKK